MTEESEKIDGMSMVDGIRAMSRGDFTTLEKMGDNSRQVDRVILDE